MWRRKVIFALIAAVLLVAGWFVMVPGLAQGRIEHLLAMAGQKPYAIGKIMVRPPYALARDIKLDEHGFNTIELLRVKFDGPGLGLEDVRIDNARTSTTLNSMPDILELISGVHKALPAGAVHMEKMVADFATPYGDIRFDITADIQPADKEGQRAIGAIIRARQYQLSFDSRWSGTIAPDGALKLDGDVLDGRLNVGQARLSRLNGWLSWQSHADENTKIAGQIDAGSGTVFDLPLRNITFTIGGNAQKMDMVFRTALTGSAPAEFSADLRLGGDSKLFNMVLDIHDSAAFFSDIQTLRPQPVPPVLRDIGALRLHLDYQAARRFESGPYPFSLRAISADADILTGNILIYPDTLELRGSAETDEDLAAAIQDYFSIADDKRTGGALRLDGKADSLFRKEDKPLGVSAGIENNPGE